jgi:hypothetical protein
VWLSPKKATVTWRETPMHRIVWIVSIAALLIFAGFVDALAKGNLASRPVNLPRLVFDGNLAFSVKEIKLETGVFYRWQIESKGGEEFQFFAPELWRNSWVDQIVINDVEIKVQTPYSFEFDEPGVITVTFFPIRPGRYPYYLKGYENKGMQGMFVVD